MKRSVIPWQGQSYYSGLSTTVSIGESGGPGLARRIRLSKKIMNKQHGLIEDLQARGFIRQPTTWPV